ncbi:uncharacterized protein LOC123699789 [Colias croceus]|uniref:uncharacterized protein LOC123699789 n=1 Tax=Colias crocea TaxID=72248 RepID=UPI001E28073C|nr:uncharacterized protein LOC123699789 [Colias croceus]
MEPVKEEFASLSSVSITSRIPDFWKKSPKIWFIQTEAVLSPQKMSDEAKYQIVISKLTPEVIEQVTDILISPPETGKYEKLKRRLLQIFEESEDRQIKKLIGEMELGDQKPSQLMRKMQDLARGRVTTETLLVLWQNLLPPAIRAVLAVSESKSEDILASIADKVMESMTPLNSVSAVQQSSLSNSPENNLIGEIEKLNNRLRRLETRNNTSNFRTRSRSRSRGRFQRNQRHNPNWLCKYHYKYKNKATKCVKPCNWKPSQREKPAEN